MKFTIITVCYNAQKDIEKTIASVLGQTYGDFQYIIKDGKSEDNTFEIAKTLAKDDERVELVSCSDGGIYDAMNQALRMSKGEYVFFLNAGDVFNNSNVLSKISAFINNEMADIVYGDVILEKSAIRQRKRYGKNYQHRFPYLLGGCICHQAVFAKRELFEKKLFDTNYRICADRDWQLYYLGKKASFLATSITISDVPIDGFSMQNVEVFEKEAEECIKKYYPREAWMYMYLCKCKRNKLVQKLINVTR